MPKQMPWDKDPIVKSMPWDNDPVVGGEKQPSWRAQREGTSRWGKESMGPVQPMQASRQENLGVMPFVNKALASTLGAAADVIDPALKAVLPQPSPGVRNVEEGVLSTLGSKNIERGMEAVGAQLPEPGRTPETLPEYAGTAVGEVAALLLPSSTAVKMLQRGTGLASMVANNVVRSMAKHPFVTMASEVTGGIGAGTARGVATEAFPDSSVARTTVEIAGGVAGSMSPILAINTPTALALRTGNRILKKITLPFSKPGSLYRAGKFTKELTPSPQRAAEEAAKPTIGDLPPVVASGEKRLIELYKAMIGQDPAQDEATINKLAQSIIKLEGEMRKLGYGSPDLLAEITKKRVAAIELGMDKRVVAATEKAQGLIDALPVAERRVAESRIVKQELTATMQAEREKVQELWKLVNKDTASGFEETRATYARIVDDLSDAQKVDLPDALKANKIITDEDLTETTVKQMQGLRSKLLEELRIAQRDKKGNTARIAGEVADAILTDLDTTAAGGVPELRAALAATKQFRRTFETGITGEILGLRRGVPRISPDVVLDISVGRMGTRGSVDIKKIAPTPEGIEAAKRYVLRSFTDFVQPQKTGPINPEKAAIWLRNNEDIVDNFPGMREQLRTVEDAQRIADATRIRMNARKEALKDPNVSVSARFLNAAKMDNTVKSIITAKNPALMADELVRQAGKDTSGAALKGLRAGFVDYIIEKASVGPFDDQGVQTLSGRSMLNFIDKNYAAVKQVFDQSQIAKMRTVARELVKIEKFDEARRVKPDLEFNDFASNMLQMLARIQSARIGGKISKHTPGGSLQTAQILSGRAKKFMAWLTKQRAEKLVIDAMMSDNPNLLQSLLLPINKPSVAKTNLAVVSRNLNLWLAGPGKRVMDDIDQEIEESGGYGTYETHRNIPLTR